MNRGSLYNQYRPSKFSEIFSQDSIVQVLTNSIVRDRVANAYLFRGSKGSGKTSTARIFSKAVNCSAFKDLGDLCGECEGCRRALDDAIEIDAASNRGVEEVEQLLESIRYLPKFVGIKFVIIDEAHQLTATALSALLKAVEEPPKHIKFIFCTTKELAPATVVEQHGTLADKAFMTLASRCQIFKFKKISDEGILGKLRLISASENIPVGEDVLLGFVGKSHGSLRDAENLLDSAFSFDDDEAISLLYGDISLLTVQLLRSCCLESIGNSLTLVNQIWNAGGTSKEVAEDILNYISDIFQAKSGLTVYRPSDIVNVIEEISENVEQNRLNSIAVAFSDLHRSNRESVLSIELAVCWGMASQVEEAPPPVEIPIPLEPKSDIKELPDAQIW